MLHVWVMYVFAFVVTVLVQYIRIRKRRNQARCMECNYDLRGNVSGICPECGCAARNQGRAPIGNLKINTTDSNIPYGGFGLTGEQARFKNIKLGYDNNADDDIDDTGDRSACNNIRD